MEICFVRHGETDWNKEGRLQGMTDIPLNEVGRAQAKLAAEYFQYKDYEAIYTSPLSRAKETAEIIQKQTKLSLTDLDLLKEKCFGDAEGLTREESAAKFVDDEFPNQETLEAFIERMNEVLHYFEKQCVHKKVIAVAHGAVINRILAIVSNGEVGSGKTLLANVGLSTITYNDGKWNVISCNETGHLMTRI